MNIDGERVYITDAAADDVNIALGAAPAIVAYKTEGGKVVDAVDVIVITAADIATYNGSDIATELGLDAMTADFASYVKEQAQVNVDNVNGTPADEYTFYLGAYINGIAADGTAIEAIDFKDMTDGDDLVIIYDDSENDLIYVLK